MIPKQSPPTKSPQCSLAPSRVQQPATSPSVLKRHPNYRALQCRAIGSTVSTKWNDDDYIEVGTLGRAHGIKGEVIVGLSTSSPDERFIQAPPAQGAFVTRPPEPPRQVHLTAGRKHITKGNQVWLLRFEECPDRDTAETLRNYRVLIHKSDREALTDIDEFYSNDLVGLTVAMVSHHPAVSDSSASSASDSEASDADSARPADDASGAADLASAPAGPGVPGDGVAAADSGSESSSGGEGDSEDEDEDDEEEEEVVVALGRVVDVYDGTGTHGVLRIEFREGLQMLPDGQLVELTAEERRVAEESGGGALTQPTGLLPFARDIVPEVDLEEGLIVVDPPDGWLELYLTPKEKKRRKHRKRKSPKPLPVAIEA